MNDRYDIIIIGSGPAGVAAAINAVIRKKKIKLFGSRDLSHKLVKSPRIDNYPGFYGISGNELKDRFIGHLQSMDIEISEEKVDAVYSMGNYFVLAVKEKLYEATAVIVATGVSTGRILPGENEFLGKGVGYCATCDAPLFKNKTVAIVGYEPHGEEDANFMLDVAKEVYYIPMYDEVKKLKSGVKLIKGMPREIIGTDKAEKLVLHNGEVEADGIFLLKDMIMLDQLVPGVEVEGGHFTVNRQMETNIKGLYAAGDCTGKPYQYIKAAGEGQVAALNAVSYIDNIT
ncbi:MAG: NAD(P)/FAD-dependent oxidoreductase [Eubacteriaceae bacterium]|nr:NAD(P)/FAD-dependent oxidoreductase [Eubacteriaceae bacterium]